MLRHVGIEFFGNPLELML